MAFTGWPPTLDEQRAAGAAELAEYKRKRAQYEAENLVISAAESVVEQELPTFPSPDGMFEALMTLAKAVRALKEIRK